MMQMGISISLMMLFLRKLFLKFTDFTGYPGSHALWVGSREHGVSGMGQGANGMGHGGKSIEHGAESIAQRAERVILLVIFGNL